MYTQTRAARSLKSKVKAATEESLHRGSPRQGPRDNKRTAAVL